MAGKEHHHVWRMLQRGFGEKRGADHHVWIYEKNEPPKQRGTRNFGVEKYFYGELGSETDRKITDFENSIQGAVQDARNSTDGFKLDPKFAASLIAHLEVRSNFVRTEISNLTERLTISLREQLSSPDNLRELIKAYLKKNPEKYEAFFDKLLLPANQRQQATKLMNIYIEQLPPHDLMQTFKEPLNEIINLFSRLPDQTKLAHNKAILEISGDSPREKNLRSYSYSIYRPANDSLILPDTCCTFIGKGKVSPFSQPNDNVETVIVPISSEVAIVGRNKHEDALSIKTVNRLLAGCSYKTFLAHDKTTYFQSLRARIGKYSKIISTQEVQDLTSFGRLLDF